MSAPDRDGDQQMNAGAMSSPGDTLEVCVRMRVCMTHALGGYSVAFFRSLALIYVVGVSFPCFVRLM